MELPVLVRQGSADSAKGQGQPHAAAPLECVRGMMENRFHRYSALLVILQAFAYILFVLFFKLVVSDPHRDEKSGTYWLRSLRFHFDVPLFHSMFITTTWFIVVSLYLLKKRVVVPESQQRNLSTNPTGSNELQSLVEQFRSKSQISLCGVPLGMLALFTFFNVLNTLTEMYGLLYLPASILEAVMMMTPALSIALTIAFQPSIQYNFYAYLSVLPIVVGGTLSSLPKEFFHDAGFIHHKNYGLGLCWAFAASVVTAMRIIVIDCVSGTYESTLERVSSNSSFGGPTPEVGGTPFEPDREDSPLVQGREIVSAAPGGNDADLLAGDPTFDAVNVADTEKKFPSVLHIMRIQAPLSAVAYLVISLVAERSGRAPGDSSYFLGGYWRPAERSEQILKEPNGHGRYATLLFVIVFGEGVMASVTLLVEVLLIERTGSYSMAIFKNLNRAVAALAAVAVLRESYAWWQFLGLIVMLFGIGVRFLLGAETSSAAGPSMEKLKS
ncbi:unnamed protein product [Amoebophrya sp. A120]|nr:unnamed protein product [Amoebophrya sp. A120]|eukprot:GSA120T00004961001.1